MSKKVKDYGEPWAFNDKDDDDRTIVDNPSNPDYERDMKRAVLCVNACRGIPDKQLKKILNERKDLSLEKIAEVSERANLSYAACNELSIENLRDMEETDMVFTDITEEAAYKSRIRKLENMLKILSNNGFVPYEDRLAIRRVLAKEWQ